MDGGRTVGDVSDKVRFHQTIVQQFCVTCYQNCAICYLKCIKQWWRTVHLILKTVEWVRLYTTVLHSIVIIVHTNIAYRWSLEINILLSILRVLQVLGYSSSIWDLNYGWSTLLLPVGVTVEHLVKLGYKLCMSKKTFINCQDFSW